MLPLKGTFTQGGISYNILKLNLTGLYHKSFKGTVPDHMLRQHTDIPEGKVRERYLLPMQVALLLCWHAGEGFMPHLSEFTLSKESGKERKRLQLFQKKKIKICCPDWPREATRMLHVSPLWQQMHHQSSFPETQLSWWWQSSNLATSSKRCPPRHPQNRSQSLDWGLPRHTATSSTAGRGCAPWAPTHTSTVLWKCPSGLRLAETVLSSWKISLRFHFASFKRKKNTQKWAGFPWTSCLHDKCVAEAMLSVASIWDMYIACL